MMNKWNDCPKATWQRKILSGKGEWALSTECWHLTLGSAHLLLIWFFKSACLDVGSDSTKKNSPKPPPFSITCHGSGWPALLHRLPQLSVKAVPGESLLPAICLVPARWQLPLKISALISVLEKASEKCTLLFIGLDGSTFKFKLRFSKQCVGLKPPSPGVFSYLHPTWAPTVESDSSSPVGQSSYLLSP